jgi:hypothetical protein
VIAGRGAALVMALIAALASGANTIPSARPSRGDVRSVPLDSLVSGGIAAYDSVTILIGWEGSHDAHGAAIGFRGDAARLPGRAPGPANASAAELRGIIARLRTYPEAAPAPNGGGDSAISVTAWRGAAAPWLRCRKVLGQASSRAYYRDLQQIFADRPVAQEALHHWACPFDLVPHDPPRDETGSVRIVATPLAADSSRGRAFVGTVRVTNTSRHVLRAPLSLVVLSTPLGDRLADPAGSTCNIAPAGAGYVTLPVGDGLAPGASISRDLRLQNDGDAQPPIVRFRLFAGPGTR